MDVKRIGVLGLVLILVYMGYQSIQVGIARPSTEHRGLKSTSKPVWID